MIFFVILSIIWVQKVWVFIREGAFITNNTVHNLYSYHLLLILFFGTSATGLDENLMGAVVPTFPRIAGLRDRSGGPSTASGIAGVSEGCLVAADSGALSASEVAVVFEGRLDNPLFA